MQMMNLNQQESQEPSQILNMFAPTSPFGNYIYQVPNQNQSQSDQFNFNLFQDQNPQNQIFNPIQVPNGENQNKIELEQNKFDQNIINEENGNEKTIPNIQNENIINTVEQKTKLENKFSFWYRISDDIIQYQSPKQALDEKIYETQVKKIHEFDTVEDFWGIFQHLRKPDSCKPGIEFMMFKEPIKPMWEDEFNKNGGRISLKLRKKYTTIIWEEMIFALISGIIPNDMKNEINGIVVSSRKEFNTLQIWFKTYDEKINSELGQCIRDLLVIPPEVNLEIRPFNKSKKENFQEKEGNTKFNNSKGYNNYNKGYNDYKDKNSHKKYKHYNNYNKNK